MYVPETQQQRETCLDIWSDSFGIHRELGITWIERTGWDRVRCVEADGDIAAIVIAHEFGQYFGGKCIDCAGIAGVACAPHHRGKGLTRHALAAVLREQHARGVPLSALYPSTRTLYRRLGYESAGSRNRIEVQTRRIAIEGEQFGIVRPMRDTDRPTVELLQEQFARQHNGTLRRNAFLWTRAMSGRIDQIVRRYVIESLDQSTIEGYFTFSRTQRDDESDTIDLPDVVIHTPTAARTLLRFLAGHRSVIATAGWWGSTNEPALMLLNEAAYSIRLKEHWMLRIVDVERALAQRGYAPSACGRALRIEVYDDDVIESNNGQFALSIDESSNAIVEHCSGHDATDVRVSIRGLAAIYSGFLSPHEARIAGLLECGDDLALETATAIFAGPQPWMPEGF